MFASIGIGTSASYCVSREENPAPRCYLRPANTNSTPQPAEYTRRCSAPMLDKSCSQKQPRHVRLCRPLAGYPGKSNWKSGLIYHRMNTLRTLVQGGGYPGSAIVRQCFPIENAFISGSGTKTAQQAFALPVVLNSLGCALLTRTAALQICTEVSHVRPFKMGDN
jgi:hypothetical protein